MNPSLLNRYTRFPKIGTKCIYAPNMLTNIYGKELEANSFVLVIKRGNETGSMKTVTVVTAFEEFTTKTVGKYHSAPSEGAKEFTVLLSDLAKQYN